MTIDDLRTGYLVEFREEGYGIIGAGYEKIIIYQDYSYDSINDWNEDLTDKEYHSFDIMTVYKPKKEASLMLSLDDYELIWERDDYIELANKACEQIEEEYKCVAKYKPDIDSYYEFTFDFGVFAFKVMVLMDNIPTIYELLRILYRHMDEEILSYFKY